MQAKKSRGGGGSERSWELEEIQQLIDVLIERGVDEFELERNGLRIRIRRGAGAASNIPGISVAPSAVVPIPAAIPRAPAAASPAPSAPAENHSSAAPAEASAEETTDELHIVKSPMVGTFYNSPSPDAAPFVKLGDVVRVEQVLCIIEAMKLMNEIESDVAGEICRVYVESGQPVEYGQSLFAIKPSHKR